MSMIKEFFRASKQLGDQNPYVMMCWFMGVGGVTLPLIFVPMRMTLGLDTSQFTKNPDPYLQRWRKL